MGWTSHYSSTKHPVGRDHHVNGYSIFLAGGGIKKGLACGETDEFGYHAIKDRLESCDIHATVLHRLGIDHEQLTFRFGGRDVSLTAVL